MNSGIGIPRAGRVGSVLTAIVALVVFVQSAAAIENGADAAGDCRLRCVGTVDVPAPLSDEPPPWARGGVPWEWALEGSCVFIGDRRVITARHVLVDAFGDLRPPEEIRFGFRRPDGTMAYAQPLIIWDMELCPQQSDPARRYHDLAVALLPYDHGLEAAGIVPARIGALPEIGTPVVVAGWGANQTAEPCFALSGFGVRRSAYASVVVGPLYESSNGACDNATSFGFRLGRFALGNDCSGRLTDCTPLLACPPGYGMPLSVDSGGGVFAEIGPNCDGCAGSPPELRATGVISSSNFNVGDDNGTGAGIAVWNLAAAGQGLPRMFSARDPDGDGLIDRQTGAAALIVHAGSVCLGDFNGDGSADTQDVTDYLLDDPWFDYLRP